MSTDQQNNDSSHCHPSLLIYHQLTLPVVVSSCSRPPLRWTDQLRAVIGELSGVVEEGWDGMS